MQKLMAIRALRKLPARTTRWAALLLPLALLLLFPRTRGFAIGVWAVVNLFLLAAAGVWALLHPRTALFGSRAGRWSLWLTLMGSLAEYSTLDSILAAYVSQLPGPASSFSALAVLVAAPFLFLLAWVGGGVGAGLHRGRIRRAADPAAAAQNGTSAWWITVLGAALLEIPLTALSAPLWVHEALWWGTPLASAMTAAWIEHPTRGPHALAERFARLLSSRLVWRRREPNRGITLDFRGAALGFAASCLVLSLGSLHLFRPFQASVLSIFIRVRNAWPASGPFSDRQDARPARPSESAVVLLHMDANLRYQALTSRSESDVQAEVIRKLSRFGVTRVVLPLPLLETRAAMFPTPATRNGPAPDPASIGRSIRDLPVLAAAVRESGRIALALPEFHQGASFGSPGDEPRPNTKADTKADAAYWERVALLKAAALETGASDLGAYGTPSLTAISVEPGSLQPIPLILLAAFKNRPLEMRGSGDSVSVAGQSLPLIGPNTVLAAGSEPAGENDLVRVDYSAALSNAPIFAGAPSAPSDGKPSSGKKVTWIRAGDFLRGKIVFLEPMADAPRETPAGVLPRTEVLAGATSALLRGSAVRQTPGWVIALYALLAGTIVGQLCARRDPFDAALPAVAVGLIMAGNSLVQFTASRVYVDPVMPMASILGALVLATQFTFRQERAARDRNRALLQRFVAPQFVEEMLDDPEGKLGLGGRRADICILFADVRNFTRFAETHSPEQVVETVNDYMTPMTDVLHAHGGILDKYTGDGLMAFFLLTDDPREQVRQAVQAALAMRDAAESVAERLADEGRAALRVGIGLHRGPAVVGIVGNPVHQVNYTALGEAVVIAARLQGLAAGGEVVISESVHDLIGEDFRTEPGDPVMVKGVSAMVRPYRVIRGIQEQPPPVLTADSAALADRSEDYAQS